MPAPSAPHLGRRRGADTRLVCEQPRIGAGPGCADCAYKNKKELFFRFFGKHVYRVILGTILSEKRFLERVKRDCLPTCSRDGSAGKLLGAETAHRAA